jgi:hypothetical protein
MPCDAIDWMPYQGTTLRRIPGSEAYFYVTDLMEIDADGAPNAYHPDDIGIDALANAGFPDGGWKSVLVSDPANQSKPFTQTMGPFAGFFMSMTTLQDGTREKTDQARYVDAGQVPYIVFPGQVYATTGTGDMGDLAMVRNLKNSKTTAAIVADLGPSHAPLGEVSIRLAENLGGVKVNPRNGSGIPKGPFLYVLFPKSRGVPLWPVAPHALEERAAAALAEVGGWERVLGCVEAE